VLTYIFLENGNLKDPDRDGRITARWILRQMGFEDALWMRISRDNIK
jgi:hypothetical protein